MTRSIPHYLSISALASLLLVHGCGASDQPTDASTRIDGGSGLDAEIVPDAEVAPDAPVTPDAEIDAQIPADAATAGACGVFWDERADCEACIEASCCAELQACDPTTDSPCGHLVACLRTCGFADTVCRNACGSAAPPEAVDAFEAFNQCHGATCAATDACIYDPGGFRTTHLGCASCVNDTCYELAVACFGDMDCARCATEEPTAGLPCGAEASESNLRYQAWNACLNTGTCAPNCATSICGSNLYYAGYPGCNFCLTQNCCDSFAPCAADAACNECISSGGVGCEANALYLAFQTCLGTPGSETCGDYGECPMFSSTP